MQGVAPILLTGIIAAATTFMTGFFVLPTLASDEVRRIVGKVVLDLGHDLSGSVPAILSSPNLGRTFRVQCHPSGSILLIYHH